MSFSTFQIMAINTYALTYIDFFVYLSYIVFLKKAIWDGETLVYTKNWILPVFVLFILTVFISGLNPLFSADNRMILQYFKTTSHFLALAFFPIVLSFVKIDEKTWKRAFQIFIITCILHSIFALYQIYARAYNLPFAWIQITNVSVSERGQTPMESINQLSLKFGGFYRATSIFTEPTGLAGHLLVGLIYLVIPYIRSKVNFFKNKTFTFAAFFIVLIGLFFTFTLTGLVGICCIIILSLVIEKSKKRLQFVLLAVGGLIAIIAANSFVESFTGTSVMELFSKRVTSITSKSDAQYMQGESFQGRVSSMKQSIQIFQDNPAIGCGAGLTGYNKGIGIMHADTSIFAILGELGLVGAIPFCLLFILLFYYSYRLRRDVAYVIPDEQSNILGTIPFYIMCFLFIINFISGNNWISIYFYAHVGFVISILNNSEINPYADRIRFRLVEVPLKVRFHNNITNYLKGKSIEKKY